MSITKQQIKQIEKSCLEFFKELDFAHNIEHMNRTVKIAEFIAKEKKANLELVKLGTMVHQHHDNLNDLRGFFKKIDLKSKVAEKLIERVKFRPFIETPKKNPSLEAQVVFDADALQVLGPFGIVREVACNIKARNKPLGKSIEDASTINGMKNFNQVLC